MTNQWQCYMYLQLREFRSDCRCTHLFIFCSFLRNVDVTGTSSVTCMKANNSVISMQAGYPSYRPMAPPLNSVVGNPYSSFSDDQQLVSGKPDDGSNDNNDSDADHYDEDDDEDDDDSESRAMDMFEEQFLFGDR